MGKEGVEGAEEKGFSQIAQLAIPAAEVASLYHPDDISTIEFVSVWGYDCKKFLNPEEEEIFLNGAWLG